MSRRPLAAAILGGLIIGMVAVPNAAGAANTVSKNPPQVVAMQPAKLAKLQGVQEKSSGGFWVTVQKYPSPYGSLSGISKVAYGTPAHWNVICNANGIKNCNLVFVGQRINVPALGDIKPTPVVKTPQVAARPATVTVTSNWVHPLRVGNPTSSCFGMRWGTMHKGIDYPAPTGTPIRAVGSGTVVKAGWNYSGYGISVMVSHGGNLYTHYAHASRLAVSVGQRVSPGQVIAYVGATGDATGPHLHFEVHANGIWSQINPGPWLRNHGVSTGC
jgi:murein DD-endopeptidase MepM/ murein hydrolase activator NlpD